MEQDRQLGGLAALVDGEVGRVRQLATVDVGPEVDAPDAAQLAHPVELGHGRGRVLHRQGRQAHEAQGVRGVRLVHRVVHRARQPTADLTVGEVHHGRGERQRVDVHPLAVHRLDAAVEVPVGGVERGRAALAQDQDRAGGIGAIDPRAEALADFFDDPEEGLRKVVGVDVDRRRRAHGRGLYYSRRHEPCQSGPSLAARSPSLSGGRDVRLPPERFEYSAIVDRRPWKLPRGARIAVWTIVNVEEWDIEKATARQYLTSPQGVPTIPDVPNWAWHDYGMRVGFWRLYEALKRRRLRATTAINANVCHSYPRVAQAMLEAGWEFMGHGGQAGRHAPAARPARRGARHGGHHREVHRQEAQGLAGAGPHRDVGDARPAGRGGNRVRVGLGQRRPALRDPHQSRPAGLGALHARAERHPDDGHPAPRVIGVARDAAATSSTACTPRGPRAAA